MLRARCLPSSLCCLPRIRGHASSPLLFFFLSTRFATSLTFVFVLFPQLLASSASSPAFPQMSTHSPATTSPCSSTRAPSALERKIFLRRRGFRQRFSSKHFTTARELRRGARGRCPRRGEEEALRIDTDVENRRTQGSFSFLSLSSLQTSRGGLLLAESALFTLPSLLFAPYEGGTQVRHCFFFFSLRVLAPR